MMTYIRFWKPALASMVAALALAGCSGDEVPVKTKAAAVSNPATARWAFMDAFSALKSSDPARRIEGVDWIGAHLGAHPTLAKDALRAASNDDDAEVASRARGHLRALGERVR